MSVQNWYGVVKSNADAAHDDTFEVEYLSPKPPRGVVWEFEGCTYDCPIESIVQHVPVDEDRGAQYAWVELGFRMINGSQMVREDEEGDVPIGDAAFEIYSSDDDDDVCKEEMEGFVVNDEEPFTFAGGEFAEETHACVRAFNSWQPEPGSAMAHCKEKIQQVESRAAREDDDRQFRAGNTAVPYNHPPT